MVNETELRAELARTRAELLAVLSVAQTLRASRDLGALYHAVVLQIDSILHPDSVLIALYLREQNLVRFVYAMDEGIVSSEVNERQLDDSPLNGRIIRSRATLMIDDLDRNPVRQTGKLIPFGNTAKRSRAWLGVPMINGDEIIGVLSVQSYRPAAFSSADADLLALLASQVAIAVENARLFDQLRRTIVELSTPVIPVAAHILLLPIIGTVDADRAERLLEQTLDAIVTRQASTLLIDVSGIASVDGVVIAQLAKLTKAAALLGAQCYLVGLSAALAQATVQLGLGLERVRVFRDVEGALDALVSPSG